MSGHIPQLQEGLEDEDMGDEEEGEGEDDGMGGLA
jgi:hypothetical protein